MEVFCIMILGGLYLEGLIRGGAYFRNFTVSQPVFTAAWKATVAQKGHRCKLKMLLQIKNSTCKLKIVHAN